jgi:hypothetical protein
MNTYLDQNREFDLDHGIKSEWSKTLQHKIAKNKSVIEVIKQTPRIIKVLNIRI